MSYERLRPALAPGSEKIEELKRIVPEAFADGKINWQTLKEALGEHLEDEGADAEHFGLFWPGKREARRLAAIPSKGTLVPIPGEGIDEETTRNIFIEGENLEVLKLLQKSYAGRIKMIYIDPPYNTGNDFVYEDDFREPLEEYLRRTGQVDEEGKPWTTNTRADGRFHSKWLNMMFPRLKLARNLLRDDGVIFVSIDDNEEHNLRQIMNEIFGEENFLGNVVWQTATDNNATQVATEHEYILCYCKNVADQVAWESQSEKGKLILAQYDALKKKHGKNLDMIEQELRKWIRGQSKNGADLAGVSHYSYVDEKGVFYPGNSANTRPGGYTYDIIHPSTKKVCKKPAFGYRWPERTFEEADRNGDVLWGEDHTKIPKIKKRLETATEKLKSSYYEDNRATTSELQNLFDGTRVFDNPKSPRLLTHFMKFIAGDGDLVLDFFAGSGTTAQAVFEMNSIHKRRMRFILVQMPELCDEESTAFKAGYKTISEICKERIRRSAIKIAKDLSNDDLGFKSFALTSSHYNLWEGYDGKNLAELESKLDLFQTPLVGEWKPENLLTEILLIEGFPLDSKIEKLKDQKKNTVYHVSSEWCEHKLLVCLDKKVADETIKSLRFGENDVFVCLDSALDEQSKMRLADICKLKTI